METPLEEVLEIQNHPAFNTPSHSHAEVVTAVRVVNLVLEYVEIFREPLDHF